MKVDYIDIIHIVLFFQLLTLIPFLIFYKGKNAVSNRILALLLFSKALNMTHFLCFSLKDIALVYFPHLFLHGISFAFLWGPSLYFYTKSLTFKNFRFYKRDIIHLLPFLGY